jgi:hypothetical protein
MAAFKVVDGKEIEMSQEELQQFIESNAPSLKKAKRDKLNQIELERVHRCEQMPYELPDGTVVQVQIKEEPPRKPRLTWLSGNASWGKTKADEGDTSTTDELIAADDSRHPLTTAEWKEFGKALQLWIRKHIDAAAQHAANVQALTTVEEVQSYDHTANWPS